MGTVHELPSLKGFNRFLKRPPHRTEILIILATYAALFVVFKYLYPLPSTLTDSANYVYCAKMHEPGGYRPYGYSWFLNFVHAFSSSITAVSMVQFLLTAFSTLFFSYSIKYFFKLSSGYLWYGFLIITIIAPPTLYMAHSLLSDSLFCALTVTWFTAGIWIICTRNLGMYALHLISLYWALEVRYTGLFYPAFTILIVLFSFKNWSYRLGLTAACLIVSIYFYKSTKSEMKKIFGVEVFSGFSGWQLVSNALHVVPHVQIKPERARDPQTRMFLQFINQTDKEFYNRGVSAHFMWHKESPLKYYTYWKMQNFQLDYLRSWLLCSNDFTKFGRYLIKEYPGAFFHYYLLPNTWNLLYPPTNRGAIARIEDITADDLMQEYYGIEKGRKFSEGRSTLFTTLSPYLSVGNLLVWFAFLGSLGYLTFRWKILFQEKEKFYSIAFLSLFALGYAAFNVFAGPFEYRYGIPIRPILIILPLLAISLVLTATQSLKKG
jgi:hypothetical protein